MSNRFRRKALRYTFTRSSLTSASAGHVALFLRQASLGRVLREWWRMRRMRPESFRALLTRHNLRDAD